MIDTAYPFFSAIIASAIAQGLKPFIHYFLYKKWNSKLFFDSGGLPSSHTAMVTALTLAVGYIENFSSTIFAVTAVFSLIIMYDAANVRFYAGRNIQITRQLIKDVQNLTKTQLEDPIYSLKLKDVLGHKWIEVFGGIIVGVAVASFLHFFM